jgi:hypothetical protein
MRTNIPLLLGGEAEVDPVVVDSSGGYQPSERETWKYASTEALDGDAWRAPTEALPEGIIRGQGVLCLKEDPERRTVFQLLGMRWSVEPVGDWGSFNPVPR